MDSFPAEPAAFSSRVWILGLFLGDLGFVSLLQGPLLPCTEPFYCWVRFSWIIVCTFEVSCHKHACLDVTRMWIPWLDRWKLIKGKGIGWSTWIAKWNFCGKCAFFWKRTNTKTKTKTKQQQNSTREAFKVALIWKVWIFEHEPSTFYWPCIHNHKAGSKQPHSKTC